MASYGSHADNADCTLRHELQKAVDLFLMKKFDKSLDLCNEVIGAAQCEPEQERNDEVIEAATALGIQALAELDQWQDTVAFIKQVYGDVHLWSPRIVQVCILLHAEVEEFLPCHKLVQSWLQHSQNAASKHCFQVLRLYSQHILLPLGQFRLLEETIKICPLLSEKEKSILREMPEKVKVERYKEAKSLPQDEDALSETESLNETPTQPKDQICILDLCKKLYVTYLARFDSQWRNLFIVIVMAFLAFWALVQTQTGDSVSSIRRMFTLWHGLLNRIKLLITSS